MRGRLHITLRMTSTILLHHLSPMSSINFQELTFAGSLPACGREFYWAPLTVRLEITRSTFQSLTISRNRRRDFINTNWERIQGVKSIFLYRHCILVISMLFYTSLWSVMPIILLFEPKADIQSRTIGRYPWP